MVSTQALMTLRYWLVAICVALPIVTCNVSHKGNHGTQPNSLRRGGGVHDQEKQPSRHTLPLYPRAPHTPIKPTYPHWPLPNRDLYNLRVHWPNIRSHTPPDADLSYATPERPHISRSPRESSHESTSVLRPPPIAAPRRSQVSSLLLGQVSEPHNRWKRNRQWMWPRKFFLSSSTSGSRPRLRSRVRSRDPQRTCENGKVWRHGACQCPFFSNWDNTTNRCECIYGTYLHTPSGQCRYFY